MRERVVLSAADVLPAPREVLAAVGMSLASGDARADRAVRAAIERLAVEAHPEGVFEEVPAGSFAGIYGGEGRNENDTPIARILPRAERLAIFAVTLGEGVSRAIRSLFDATDFAVGALLDAAASEAAERAAAAVERRFEAALAADGALGPATLLMRYSPGYCGWDLTGQRALFAALAPGECGITLRESCLMEPLKSISGVIVSGPAEIHDIEANFEFCPECVTQTCRERVRLARSAAPREG